MPFTPDDAYRINRFIGLAPELVVTQITPRMDALTALSPAVVDDVLDLLAKLSTLEATLQTEAGSVDFALIKLDVIEFQPGQRTAGILLQSLALLKRLGKIMGIPADVSSITAFLSAMGISSVSAGIQVPKGRV
jgi:hypothetical protein